MPTVYGSPVSPFVCKVLVALEFKGIDYQLEIVSPAALPPNYQQKHPLKLIPAYEDNEVTLPDSSVICDYIEHKYPTPMFYPTDFVDRSRALWFQAYGDSKLASVLSAVFFERLVKPKFLKKATDEERVNNILNQQLPEVFTYLESVVPSAGFMVANRFGIADTALITHFISAHYAKLDVDEKAWPRLADYVSRAFDHPLIKKRMESDSKMFQ